MVTRLVVVCESRVLFCRVVVLGVLHKFRTQDLKALGGPTLRACHDGLI